MLGGEPILTRDGGTLTDGHGHHPYVTTAGSAPSLGKHVLLAYLPPDQAALGNAARGVLHGGALPGHGGLGRTRRRLFDPVERAHQGIADGHGERPRLHQAGAGDLRRDPADRRRAGRRRPACRLHAQRARRVRGRARHPDREGDRRRGHRAVARLGGLRRADPRRARGRLHGGGAHRGRRRGVRPGRCRARPSPRWSASARPRARRTTWSWSATTRPTPATSRSASGSPTRSGGRCSPASTPSR